jgi:hypothetical protein
MDGFSDAKFDVPVHGTSQPNQPVALVSQVHMPRTNYRFEVLSFPDRSFRLWCGVTIAAKSALRFVCLRSVWAVVVV